MLNKIITASDSIAFASTSVLGAVASVPPVETVKLQIILWVVSKVLGAAPAIIRAIKTRRTARKAAVK